MNIFLKENELKEIKPLDDSEDKGIVIQREHKGGRPNEEEKRPDIIKEVIANDTIELGPRASAFIHGVSEASAKNYANGKGITDPDAKVRIIDAKNQIEDLAVTKLMQTLNLLDPTYIDKERDKVTVINGLSQVIERINGGSKQEGTKVMHLHLHAPDMKKESDYDVIEA